MSSHVSCRDDKPRKRLKFCWWSQEWQRSLRLKVSVCNLSWCLGVADPNKVKLPVQVELVTLQLNQGLPHVLQAAI